HRNPAGSRISAKLSERLDTVHARQLDVHQDQGWRGRLRQAKPFFGRLRLRGFIAVKLEHVPLQLAVLLVVLDDQDELAGHVRSGRENVNVEPLPNSLLTQIRPPCNSTNRRASVRPSPVPSVLRA